MSRKVRKFDNENKVRGYAKNKKMNDETYRLRRMVIDVIYEAKKHVDLPRIDVRITEQNVKHKAVGWAYIGKDIIYIPINLIRDYKPYFKEVVLHEIVHAVTSFMHDENCPLMSSKTGNKPMTESDMWKHFVKYFK